MNEEWKEIEEVDGAFVSNYGRVKSITSRGERILKPQVYQRHENDEPRLRVMIDRKKTQGKVFYPFLHTLVAKYFLPKSDSSKLIFRDGNPFYCGAFNLAWLYDFATKADHATLQRYSEFKTEIGKAVYQYCKGCDKDLQRVLARWSTSMPRIYMARYQLSETEADEAYWKGATRFMQKSLTGYITDEDRAEGLLFSMGNVEARYMRVRKAKEVSDWELTENGDAYVMDKYVYCGIDGNKVECSQTSGQYY